MVSTLTRLTIDSKPSSPFICHVLTSKIMNFQIPFLYYRKGTWGVLNNDQNPDLLAAETPVDNFSKKRK